MLRRNIRPVWGGFPGRAGVRPSAWSVFVRRPFFVGLFLVAIAGCPSPQVDCRVGADCASGVCNHDGTCAPVPGSDGGVIDGGTSGTDGGSGTPDAGASDAGPADSGTPLSCIPNGDGVVTRDEVVMRPGLHATFKVSGAASFTTAGTAQADGGRFWDFTPALSGDTSTLVETQPLAGQWFEADYPDAGYVTPLGQGSTLLAVFQATGDALLMHGVVSPTDGSTATRLWYSPPVKVLQFPLRQGDSWSTQASVTGKYNGLIVGFNLPLQTDTYTMNVDRAGDALTPYSRFGVLRVRTTMERTLNYVASPLQTVRSFSFVAECFGTVASVSSADGETVTEFTSAKEVRRLSP